LFRDSYTPHQALHSFPTRRSSDLDGIVPAPIAARYSTRVITTLEKAELLEPRGEDWYCHDYLEHQRSAGEVSAWKKTREAKASRSEEHTSELQSRSDLVCRLLLEK